MAAPTEPPFQVFHFHHKHWKRKAVQKKSTLLGTWTLNPKPHIPSFPPFRPLYIPIKGTQLHLNPKPARSTAFSLTPWPPLPGCCWEGFSERCRWDKDKLLQLEGLGFCNFVSSRVCDTDIWRYEEFSASKTC